ncbi:hypothetical protein VMA_001367 [Vibrio mimicus VM223]|nr:hypothetical protein VMA_001367 [Vibrio mimicus VM223]
MTAQIFSQTCGVKTLVVKKTTVTINIGMCPFGHNVGNPAEI